jgi:acetyltransferase
MACHPLTPLLAPGSIALVGATETPHALGRLLWENLARAGFAGHIAAVNPQYNQVFGQPCVRSARLLENAPELAVIVAPARFVPAIIEDCGARGIRHAVVLSAGFAEAGAAGQKLAAELLASARCAGVRILGPNCIGLARPGIGLNASFSRGQPQPGRLALISQSGAMLTMMVDWAAEAGIGFSSLVSLGGALDLDFGELLDYFLFDSVTESVLLYIEGVHDAARFLSGLRALARAKPVIVLKAGRRAVGARAVASHSGALTGNDRVFEAAIARAGAVRAANTTQFLAATHLLTATRGHSGRRVAIITNGGGPGVLAADALDTQRLVVANLEDATLAALNQMLPAHWSHANPVDVIGDAPAERFGAAIDAVAKDPGVDAIVAIFVPQAITAADEAARAIVASAAKTNKPIAAVMAGGVSAQAGRRILDAHPIAHFGTPETAVDALGLIEAFQRNRNALQQVPPTTHAALPGDWQAAHALCAQAWNQNRSLLDELESKALLAHFGIHAPLSTLVTSPAQAGVAAAQIGFPVVLKVYSADITHKSDVGGVRTAIASRAAAIAAAQDILQAVGQRQPQARIQGLLVQPMVRFPAQRELYLGMATDPVFGATVAFGAGGVAVERIDDVAIGLPPLNALLARRLIEGPRIYRLLEAYRNVPAIDFAALQTTIIQFSNLIAHCPWIRAIDINPLIAHPDGVLALDARIELHEPSQRAQIEARPRYAHLAIRPYPHELEGWLALRSNRKVWVRPIRPEDAERERQFFATLSATNVYRRFMMALRELTPAMIERLTQIDYARELALVALDGDSAEAAIVGVARVSPTIEPQTCEFAIVIGERWQRCGLGRALMNALLGAAHERGYQFTEGYVLAANTTMLRFCASLGMQIRANPLDPHERIARLTLSRRPFSAGSGAAAPSPESA